MMNQKSIINKALLVQVIGILIASIVIAAFVDPRVRVVPFIIGTSMAMLRLVSSAVKKRLITYEIDDNLVYMITHMYAVATGKPPRRRLFMLNTIAGGYGEYDTYLRRIAVLAVDWGYGFARAIRIVVQEIRNKVLRDFLLRLGELLNIGEDPTRFLDVERRALLSEYQAHYMRVLEAAKLLLGVYSSGVSSAIFLVITFMIFTFLYTVPPNAIVLVYIAIVMALSVLIYIMYRVLPRDRVTHTLKVAIPEKRRYFILLAVGLSLSVATGLTVYNIVRIPSVAMSVAALPLLIPGLYARRVEKRIRELETFFSIFLRSFGLTYSMIPHAPTALASVLRSDYGPLTKYLRRLLARLSAGIDPRIAWFKFIGETWSEMVRRNINVLHDAIDAGGDLARVGTVLSETIFRILDIRKQRVQVSKAFESTIYIVHTLFSAILAFVISLLQIFNTIIAKLQSVSTAMSISLPFHPMSFELAVTITPIFIIALSVINALAIKVAQGGMYETLWVPLAILVSASGVVTYGVSMLSQTVFAQMTGLTEFVKSLTGT